MTDNRVMLCACGDWRPLEQMYLRFLEGRNIRDQYVVECVDCVAGQDSLLPMPTLADMLAAWNERQKLANQIMFEWYDAKDIEAELCGDREDEQAQ